MPHLLLMLRQQEKGLPGGPSSLQCVDPWLQTPADCGPSFMKMNEYMWFLAARADEQEVGASSLASTMFLLCHTQSDTLPHERLHGVVNRAEQGRVPIPPKNAQQGTQTQGASHAGCTAGTNAGPWGPITPAQPHWAVSHPVLQRCAGPLS